MLDWGVERLTRSSIFPTGRKERSAAGFFSKDSTTPGAFRSAPSRPFDPSSSTTSFEIRSWKSLQLHRAGLPFREGNQVSWLNILLSIDVLSIPGIRLSHLVPAVRRREQNINVELAV